MPIPTPIRPVSDAQATLMFAIFLLPLLLIWSFILRIREGKFPALLLLLAPAAFILIETKVPSEKSCWLLLLSGAVYCTVCGCREGRAALLKGASAAGMLILLIFLSAFGSRPLEQYKLPADGFYAHTRESIETDWIKPLQDSYTQAKAEWETRKSAPGNDPEPEKSESGDLQSGMENEQPEQDQNPPDSGPDTDMQTDFSVESEDTAEEPLFPTGNDAGWCLLALKSCAAAFACLLVILLLFFALAALRRQRKIIVLYNKKCIS